MRTFASGGRKEGEEEVEEEARGNELRQTW